MNRWLKILLSIVGSLLILFITASIIVNRIDFNRYKPEIQRKFYQQTNRHLTIEDDIHVSLFPWLGFKIGGVTISNPNTKKTNFANIGNASIRVKLLPLLFKHVVLDKITLDNTQIYLVTYKDGTNNWSNWSNKTQPSKTNTPITTTNSNTSATKALPITQLAARNIAIDNARLDLINYRENTKLLVRAFNLTANNIAPNKVFPLTVSFQVIQPKQKQKITTKINTQVQLELARQRYTLKKFRLNSRIQRAKKPTIPLQVQGNLLFDQQRERLEIPKLITQIANLKFSGKLSSSQLNKTPLTRMSITTRQGELGPFTKTLSGTQWITGTLDFLVI